MSWTPFRRPPQSTRFAAFLGRPPDTATAEDLRRFQLSQHEHGASVATINCGVSALRFLYSVTLRRRDLARSLVPIRCPQTVPQVLTVEEAARLLEAAPGIKCKAALGVAYGAGLRISEVAHFNLDDIDSMRRLIRAWFDFSQPFSIMRFARLLKRQDSETECRA
ncbi:MAG: hypothetical protein VW935_08895, partial [Novosphingobium sp.]